MIENFLLGMSRRELKIAPSQPHVAAVPKPQAATRGSRLTASPFFGQRVSDKVALGSVRSTSARLLAQGWTFATGCGKEAFK